MGEYIDFAVLAGIVYLIYVNIRKDKSGTKPPVNVGQARNEPPKDQL